ncbi:unnamed protein product [marine sediment metagenome]|uniref:ABC transmembrane type-1 domain-containing protein n=1 Tax=marine sediment metagenome TaxID=412755 RepID=X1PUP9_9ZZZZ
MIIQVLPVPIQELLAVLAYWDHILSGFLLTMWLYGIAILFGFCFGLVLSILRQYGGRVLSLISTAYIEVVRGTPLLAQLLLLYYLPVSLNIPIGRWRLVSSFSLLGKDINLILLNHRTLVGIITLSLNSAAYQAEYLRGSYMSIGTGQLMAAQSLGMSKFVGIRHVILPQALRRVIPSWSNEAAYLPKYTIVVYFIGVEELFAEAHWIVAKTFFSLTTYIVIAVIFLVLISLISKLLDIIHKHTGIPGL